MPAKRCCVQSCYPGPGSLSHHRFPNPLKEEALFNKWVELIDNATVANTEPKRVYSNYRICGKHFDKKSFSTNNRLQKDALPQYYLSGIGSKDNSDIVQSVAEAISSPAVGSAPYTTSVEIIQIKAEPVEEFNESFWTHPRFNSLHAFIEEKDCLANICRICFQAIYDNSLHVLTSRSEYLGNDIQNKVKHVLPDLNLELFAYSSVCDKCVTLINYSIELQEKWLSAEQQLQEIIDKRKTDKAKGNDILMIFKKPTEDRQQINEPNLVTVVKEIESSSLFHYQNISFSTAKPQKAREKSLTPCYGNNKQLGYGTNPRFETKTCLKKRKTNKSRGITCRNCSQVLPTIVQYIAHTAKHVELRNKCFRCNEKFSNSRRLIIHLKTCRNITQKLLQEDSLEFACSKCQKRFLFAWYLEQHLKICPANM